MKIRDGFVSNSSSSSFVVAFKKTPESAEELQKLLFGDEKHYPDPYADPDRIAFFSSTQVARTVWEDIEHGAPLTEAQVVREFQGGYIHGEPELDYNSVKNASREEQAQRFAEISRKRDEFGTKKAQEFLNANPGAVFYLFSYSDNDSDYCCALEHGTLFDQLPHFRISHH
jgi:hypothetical protein